jgi:AraC-like DNA-binding protein
MKQNSFPRLYLYRRIVQAKIFIDTHFAEKIDLDNIADEAAFSKFHFIRLFKEIYAMTPHQYLIFVRIEKSKQMMQKGISVSDTCIAVGFESLTSFSGLFKKLTGISPSAYLHEQHNRNIAIAKVPLSFVPGCFAEAKGWK